MKVVFHEDFYEVYTMDPAAEPGRMEAVIDVIQPHVEFVNAEPAAEKDLLAVHTQSHVENVKREMDRCQVDLIAISAGFDNHERDWGGTLTTEDYREIGRMVLKAAKRSRWGCFGILEGGYNHTVLGHNAMALMEGLSGQ